MSDFKHKNIVLATHAFLVNSRFNARSGPTQPLLDYFSKKLKYFFLIGQPPPYLDSSLAPFLFIYKDGVLEERIYCEKLSWLYDIPVAKRKNKTYIRLKIRDFISVLYFARIIKRYIQDDSVWLYFGVESVNAAAGIWIKKLLNIECTVYYIFDWSTRWFKNVLLNSIYIWFDKYACRHSDYIWNIAYRIAEARREVLKYNENKMGIQLTVPYGMPFRRDLVKREIDSAPDTIVYSGYLTDENGAMILPEIADEIREIDKNIKVVVIGSGEQFEEIREKIIKRRLNNIFLKGHLSDQDEIDKLLVQSHIAIAPYKEMPYSKKKYGDVIKIRNYFACALPVISTDVPPISREIRDESLGFVLPYDAKIFAEYCVKILKDKELYQKIRTNVINKAQKYYWDKIFDNTIRKMVDSYSNVE